MRPAQDNPKLATRTLPAVVAEKVRFLEKPRIVMRHQVRLELRHEIHHHHTTISSEVPPKWNGTFCEDTRISGNRQTAAT